MNKMPKIVRLIYDQSIIFSNFPGNPYTDYALRKIPDEDFSLNSRSTFNK
jgi:hypothetical protein